LRQALAAAAGIVSGRDQFTMTSLPFDRSQETAAAEAERALAAGERAAARQRLWLGVGVAALFLIAGGLSLFLRRGRRRVELVPVSQSPAFNAVSAEPAFPDLRAPLPASRPGDETEQFAQALASQRPEEMAQLLRTWLTEP
ncbi:MAG: hypothetical protein HY320_12100, partial [Armatimonadetes bacterium]|nr:hypothetical protein [Armatimonadota bacterium]